MYTWARDRCFEPPVGIETGAPRSASTSFFQRWDRTKETTSTGVWSVRVVAAGWCAWAGNVDGAAFETERVACCDACQSGVCDLLDVVTLERRCPREIYGHHQVNLCCHSTEAQGHSFAALVDTKH
eukprot:COSAG01_NODE_1119_length_11633_cov_4.612190_2_plen_126_part_00